MGIIYIELMIELSLLLSNSYVKTMYMLVMLARGANHFLK